MSIDITSDTVLKILIRRGQNSDRLNTILNEGELGYTVDTQRLFIGDGVTPGGNPTGNAFLGSTTNRFIYNNFAAAGDTIYDTNLLYYWTGAGWVSISPLLDSISLTRESSNNALRVSNTFPGAGFNVAYPDAGTVSNLAGNLNSWEFDSKYISLCANLGSFYIGNYNNKTVYNNLSATLNVDNSLFINDHSVNPSQLQIFAKDPTFTNYNRSSIQAMSGSLHVRGNTFLSLGTNLSGNSEMLIMNGRTTNTVFSSTNNGTFSAPNFEFIGVANFDDSVNVKGNLAVYGNLSAYGPALFLSTLTTTATALSVVNMLPSTSVLFTVKQGYAQLDETVATFEGYTTTPILTIKDGPFVTVNVPVSATYESLGNSQSVFYANGGGQFISRSGIADSFTVYMPNNQVNITAGGGANIVGNTVITGTGQVTSNLTVNGTLYCSNDIIAFYSDARLKDNLLPINGALELVDKITGYSFDWNALSNRTGHDYGVIAQELEQIMPEAVSEHSDGYKAVKYERLIPLLLQAIKELKAKVG